MCLYILVVEESVSHRLAVLTETYEMYRSIMETISKTSPLWQKFKQSFEEDMEVGIKGTYIHRGKKWGAHALFKNSTYSESEVKQVRFRKRKGAGKEVKKVANVLIAWSKIEHSKLETIFFVCLL